MLTRGCCPVAVVGSAAGGGGGVQEVWSDRTYEWDQLVYDFNFNGPRQRMWMVRHSSSRWLREGACLAVQQTAVGAG